MLDSWSSHPLTWYRAPFGPPGALKGPVLAQTPLLETLRFWEGLEGSDLVPDAPDCLAWIPLTVTTHFDLVSVSFYGQNRPFLPVFDRFLKLGDSICAITVLDKQSIPLSCSGHSASLYLKQKMSRTKLCRGNLGIRDILGQKGPFLSPRGPRRGLIPGQSVW